MSENDHQKNVNDYLIERIYGVRLIETNAITKEVQRRTHRKKRINKKWLKRFGYKTVPDHGRVIRMGDMIFGTRKTIQKIIEAVEGGSHEEERNAPGE